MPKVKEKVSEKIITTLVQIRRPLSLKNSIEKKLLEQNQIFSVSGEKKLPYATFHLLLERLYDDDPEVRKKLLMLYREKI